MVASIAGALLSALPAASNMIGSFIGGGSAEQSVKEQYAYNKLLMKDQAKLNREQAEWSSWNTPFLARKGLERAGYNPLLVGTGTNMNSASPVGLNSVAPPDYVGEKNMKINSARAMVDSLNNTRIASSTVGLNSAQAYNQIQQGRLTLSQAHNLNSATELNNAQKSLNLLQQERQKIENSNLDSKMKSEIRNNITQAEANMINANANKLNSQANMINSSASAWYNRHRALGYSKTDSYYNTSSQNRGVHIHGVNAGSTKTTGYTNSITY